MHDSLKSLHRFNRHILATPDAVPKSNTCHYWFVTATSLVMIEHRRPTDSHHQHRRPSPMPSLVPEGFATAGK
ncbi:unnamed protein product [Lactuca virosa]|uniref:Uncharacterized protein n=1 Tax=Lactuca virosa TaxID=75947 RepID=A0AAU9MC32_9ASTR|nr:unnamed protein product [Lactuca virosa]